ncbi:unnamed protein product [Absidia cylindrospora]
MSRTSLRAISPITSFISRRSTLYWAPAFTTTTLRSYSWVQNSESSHSRPGEWLSVRGYAKKTSNKKKNTSSAAVDNNNKSEGDETGAAMLFDEKAVSGKFGQAIQALKEQFSALRIGRANPALLDTVRVYIEDVSFSLRDLAQVSIRDPQTLLVTVHDTEYQTAVDKSIREAGLNLNPVIDSKFIRVPIPKPTKDLGIRWPRLQVRQQNKSNYAFALFARMV